VVKIGLSKVVKIGLSFRKYHARRNKKTKEIWEHDQLHKDHYEVYKNMKGFEKGKRDRAVWDDGRLKEKF